MTADPPHDPTAHRRATWRRALWAGLPVAAFTVLSVSRIDLYVAQTVDALRSAEKQTVEYVTQLGEAEVWLYITIPGAILLWAIQRRAWSMRLAFIAASIGVAGLGVNLLKILCGRYRPGEWFEHRQYGFEPFTVGYDQNSFPSGHAMVAGAVAATLCILFPRAWRVWVLAGVIVASTRLFTGSHYLSDVVAGLYLGTLTTLAMRDLFRDRGLLDHPPDAPAGSTSKTSIGSPPDE